MLKKKGAAMEMPDAEELFDSARMAFGLGHYVEALRAVELALIAAPDNVHVFKLKAYILSELGRDPEALELTDHAIRIAPDLPDVYGAKASILIGIERYAEAENLLRTELRLLMLGQYDPERSSEFELESCYESLAESLDGQGNRAGAIEALEEGIARCDSEMLKDYRALLKSRQSAIVMPAD